MAEVLQAEPSSDVAVSTSRSNDDRNEGSPLVSMIGRGGLRRALTCRINRGAADEELEPGASKTLRVRGRFNFRSGSFGTSSGSAGAAGEAVDDLDFLFLFLVPGLMVSASFALSKAPQALTSSGVSTGVWGIRLRNIVAASLKTSRAP
jgi:hypothetical protein